ncbi:MAG: hypothetical protein U1F65_04680 [Verrucomicrobiota bacterium]
MELINYETTPGEYGQIRFFPLLLANQTNTQLEEWFVNYKFLNFFMGLESEKKFSEYHLNVEFSYSLRLKSRNFEEIKRDVNFFIDRSQFQDLFRILVLTLENANELYEIAIAKKTGNSIYELRENIQRKKQKFHKSSFPDKLKKFQIKPRFKQYLETLNAVSKARNCYEHRNGILGKEDCNEGQKLVLNFRFPAPVLNSGEIVEPLSLEAIKEHSRSQIVEQKKTFRINQRLNLGFNDSYKLLYTINFALKGIVDHIYECCESDAQVRILKQFK